MNDIPLQSIMRGGIALIAFFLHHAVNAQDIFDPPHQRSSFNATRATGAMVIDGKLSESDWALAVPVTEFLQKNPQQRATPSYPTEVRVLFDDTAIYLAAICRQPEAATRVTSLQRDFTFDDNDVFSIAIDGFTDNRNASVFQTTPRGTQRDLEVVEGADPNVNWDARWTVRTHIEADQWIAEIAIPWQSLRYPANAERLGVIFARNIRSLSETLSAPAVPRAFSIHSMAYEAELVGISPPPPDRRLQITPYVLASRQEIENSPNNGVEMGGEIKWAIAPGTVLDITANTDFAQADADRQVINLDRFSVFFPERRQFFLESANIFNPSVTEWISPFFSRRIGLDNAGSPIPIDGGLRLTNRSAIREIGLLAMQQQSQGETPSASFAVARYAKNLAGQSRIGGMLTYRQNEAVDMIAEQNHNFTYTLDGLWRPTQSFGLQGMVSASDDEALGSGLGGQLYAYYQNNRLSLSSLQYYSKDYEPGIGLELLDTNYFMHNLTASFDLRPSWLPKNVRSLGPRASAFVFRSADTRKLLFGYADLRPLRLNFHSGARIDWVIEPNWQRLTEDFAPAGIVIGSGRYNYTRYQLRGNTDQSAILSTSASIETGDYFDGRLTSYSLSLRYAPLPEIELSTDVEWDQLRDLGLDSKSKNTRVYRANARLAAGPRLQFNGFFQWDSLAKQSAWNVRLSWEYRPLSYLYLVYNSSQRDTTTVQERIGSDQLLLKATYVFDF